MTLPTEHAIMARIYGRALFLAQRAADLSADSVKALAEEIAVDAARVAAILQGQAMLRGETDASSFDDRADALERDLTVLLETTAPPSDRDRSGQSPDSVTAPAGVKED